MNIAMFTDAYYPRINGVAVSVKTYAEELSHLGHNVCIVCCNYRRPTRHNNYNTFYYDKTIKDNCNIKVLRIPSLNTIFSKEDKQARFDQYHTVKKEMEKFKPDVVHINSEFVIGYYGAAYARKQKIPMVFTFHTLWEDYIANYAPVLPNFTARQIGREFVKFYLKKADEIIAPTERIAEVVKKYGINRPVDILPTGIPSNIAKFEKKHASLFFAQLYNLFPGIKKKHILLYVGRIVKEKNLPFLFDVLGKVREKVPDTALLLVGGGPEFDALKEKAKSYPYSWNICFAGYRNRNELSYFYNISDVFVFPSVTETQGLVTIEAMTVGLPVVAIGEMGTVDVMQGDNGGFMVKNDLNDFSDRVVQLLTDKELYSNKKKEALEWSRQWSLETLTPKLVNFYNKAIEKKKSEAKS